MGEESAFPDSIAFSIGIADVDRLAISGKILDSVLLGPRPFGMLVRSASQLRMV